MFAQWVSTGSGVDRHSFSPSRLGEAQAFVLSVTSLTESREAIRRGLSIKTKSLQ